MTGLSYIELEYPLEGEEAAAVGWSGEPTAASTRGEEDDQATAITTTTTGRKRKALNMEASTGRGSQLPRRYKCKYEGCGKAFTKVRVM